MNNEKGEATLFCVLLLVSLSGLITLCGLELQKSFSLLKKRTELFLCVKETKGELNLYLERTGRLNWLLKNTSRAQVVAVFFPPLIVVAANADKLKKVAKFLQMGVLGAYLEKLKALHKRGCPIDPRMLISPYQFGQDFAYARTIEGAAKLRNKTWTYYFLEKPYLLTLKVDASKAEALYPKIKFQAEEKMGTLSSLLSSR